MNTAYDEGLVITKGTTSWGTEVEKTTITVSVGGVSRDVPCWRHSPDHVWIAETGHEVVVRFPTGTKEHVKTPSIHRRGLGWVAAVQGYRNRNACYPIRWATDADRGSGWQKHRRKC
jgi:hypothetical protein